MTCQPKALLTGSRTWPGSRSSAKIAFLKAWSIVLDGYLYSGPLLTGGSVTLNLAQLPSNPLVRTIKAGQSEKLRLIFEKPASANTALYSGTVELGSCSVSILP